MRADVRPTQQTACARQSASWPYSLLSAAPPCRLTGSEEPRGQPLRQPSWIVNAPGCSACLAMHPGPAVEVAPHRRVAAARAGLPDLPGDTVAFPALLAAVDAAVAVGALLDAGPPAGPASSSSVTPWALAREISTLIVGRAITGLSAFV